MLSLRMGVIKRGKSECKGWKWGRIGDKRLVGVKLRRRFWVMFMSLNFILGVNVS